MKGKSNFVLNLLVFFLFIPSILNAQIDSSNTQQNPPQEKPSSLKQNAYFHIRGIADESNNGDNTFQIKRARLEFKGSINTKIKYHLQFEAMQSPVIKDARVSFLYIPYIEVKLGQYKVPFSMEELTPAYDFDLIENPKVVSILAPFRDVGFSIRSDLRWLNAEVGIFNGNGEQLKDNNKKKDFNWRLVLAPSKIYSIGISCYNGMNTITNGSQKVDVRKDRLGAEFKFEIDKAFIKSEYIYGKDRNAKSEGWYIRLAYRVIPNLQAICQYEQWDPNKDIADNKENILTLGTNLFVDGNNAKIQLNYLFVNEEGMPIKNNRLNIQLQIMF